MSGECYCLFFGPGKATITFTCGFLALSIMPDTDPPNAAKGHEAQIQLAVSGHCFLENNCQCQVQLSSVHPQISVLHWSTTYCPQNPDLIMKVGGPNGGPGVSLPQN